MLSYSEVIHRSSYPVLDSKEWPLLVPSSPRAPKTTISSCEGQMEVPDRNSGWNVQAGGGLRGGGGGGGKC
jgi:hypothetical protein